MAPGQDEDKGLIESTPEMEDQLFDGAVTDETTAQPEKGADDPDLPGPNAVDVGQLRGPDGKFASKEPDKPAIDPATGKEPAKDQEGEHQVPSWRLREINAEKADAIKRADTAAAEAADLRRRLAQFEKPAETRQPEIPDPLLDFQGFTRYMQDSFEQKMRHERGDWSMRSARKSNPELFDKAYAAAAEAVNRGDQLTKDRIFNSRDPGEELIAWHREAETRREVGNDPAAYKQRVLDEAMKDPAFQAKVIAAARGSASPNLSQSQPNGSARPAVRLPPSLTSVSPSNAALKSSDGEPNDEQLFDQVTG